MNEQVYRNGKPASGLGQGELLVAPAAATPWAVALTTAIVGAGAGWLIEEVATHIRGRRR